MNGHRNPTLHGVNESKSHIDRARLVDKQREGHIYRARLVEKSTRRDPRRTSTSRDRSMCPSLGVHGTRDRDGTDAVGTALTDDWEIDVICSLARSLVRSLDRTNEGAISRPIDRIDLFASGISSRVRAFVHSCIRALIHSFIRSFIHSNRRLSSSRRWIRTARNRGRRRRRSGRRLR